MILTFLGAKYSATDEDLIQNEVEGLPDGFVPHLAVCEKISGKDSCLQRYVVIRCLFGLCIGRSYVRTSTAGQLIMEDVVDFFQIS